MKKHLTMRWIIWKQINMSQRLNTKNRLSKLQAEVYASAKILDELNTTIPLMEAEVQRMKELQERTAFSMRAKTAEICGILEKGKL